MVSRRSHPQMIQVVKQAAPAGQHWSPIAGTETYDLLQHTGFQGASRTRILQEAVNVLGHCVPPTQPAGSTTGLVVGYIQSGKTLSFTTVAALARDNDYRLVIVISGTTKNLFGQSVERLERDLRLDTRADRAWYFPKSLSPLNPNRVVPAISGMLGEWNAPMLGLAPRTVLLAVMKNRSHLDRLIAVLSQLQLAGVPTILIDDEADQAGLNTLVTSGQQSPTYSRLLRLRQSLPHHSYLQYTATPQGPLLIRTLDILSPDWAQVLNAGPGYAGGRDFFVANPRLIQVIPRGDIPTRTQPLPAPPDSLLEAMRLFFVGVAAGLQQQGDQGNRTMMVHPSMETLRHGQYAQWVRDIRAAWQRMLALPTTDPDRANLMTDFRAAHANLRQTETSLPAFDVLEPYLPGALSRTIIEEVNAAAGATPQIDWRTSYSHILVGGEVLNRGFTVEGLTVTYMPRGGGVGNADTIQQRARFFGYKQDYLGLCRVYLDADMRTAYAAYVEHEEDVREGLRTHAASGTALQDWKRAFILTLALRPTRANIVDANYTHGVYRDRWYANERPLDPADIAEHNRQVIDALVGQLQFVPDVGDPRRTEPQKHLVAQGVPLQLVYDELLTQIVSSDISEANELLRVQMQVSRYLKDHPNETCAVYRMIGGRERRRTASERTGLQQGANAPTGYPGDSGVRADQGLTVQIHTLRLVDGGRGQTLQANVPVLAVWVPAAMAVPVLIEDQ